jgi:hypothetical protein
MAGQRKVLLAQHLPILHTVEIELPSPTRPQRCVTL